MAAKQSGLRQSTISFFGTDIIALQELDPNMTYLPIWHFCECLGIDPKPQEKRVRNHAVLANGSRVLMVETDEGTIKSLCLRNDLVPLWLSGVDSSEVQDSVRLQLELFQRECASMLWQGFRPQGFESDDELLPNRFEQLPADKAYVTAMGMANLARQQMLIERQLNARSFEHEHNQGHFEATTAVDDVAAAQVAQAVRRVALAAAERTRRNEYAGIYQGLYTQFGIASYRKMPPARLYEALEWLERWRGDLMGEPEPPPDI
jgi:hypothetical protein